MKNLVIVTLVCLLVLSAFAASGKITCRITGKTMDECCCEVKGGKFYCKFTNKTYDQCCCDMK